MNELEKIIAADRKVKDTEIRLNTIRASIGAIDREIASLDAMEIELIRNLNFLKDEGIITIAYQYRKSKFSLGQCRARRSYLRIEKDSQERAALQMTKFLEQFKLEYADAVRGPKSNVLYGKFGRDRGQD